jgi:pimeloyl-ACP methyl ester carboxylesterase
LRRVFDLPSRSTDVVPLSIGALVAQVSVDAPSPRERAQIVEKGAQVVDTERRVGAFLRGAESRVVAFPSGQRIEVSSAGRGSPLVLLPPVGCEVAVWDWIWQRLTLSHLVIAVNYPGYGRSSAPAPIADVSELALFVSTAVREITNDPYHVCGWSLGGFVAQEMALLENVRMNTLTLVNTTDCLLDDAGAALAEAQIISLLTADFERDLAAFHGDKARARDSVFSGRGDRAREIFLDYARVVGNFDHRRNTAGIITPTLLVGGALDLPVPERHFRRLAATLPNVRPIMLFDAGHYAPLFHAASFAALLDEWTGA